ARKPRKRAGRGFSARRISSPRTASISGATTASSRRSTGRRRGAASSVSRIGCDAARRFLRRGLFRALHWLPAFHLRQTFAFGVVAGGELGTLARERLAKEMVPAR